MVWLKMLLVSTSRMVWKADRKQVAVAELKVLHCISYKGPEEGYDARRDALRLSRVHYSTCIKQKILKNDLRLSFDAMRGAGNRTTGIQTVCCLATMGG
jgi:hypothetical protein